MPGESDRSRRQQSSANIRAASESSGRIPPVSRVIDPGRVAVKFGTLGGVFTPCTLTILGVIMFLRFGQVVGHSGVLLALAVVLLSKTITSLTALSLSAIATNTRVQGGGAYYLISRSLGVEFGGAIGVVFYLAQAVSVAMYVIGFTEAFLATFPELGLNPTVVASVVHAIVFICVFIGAGWTIKVQYGILAVLVLSLISFFVGALMNADAERLASNLKPSWNGQSFFTMFALFFPAATGIMAGANMSGDLENPARSIPRGTLASIGVTALVYLLMAAALGAAASREALQDDNLVVRNVSFIPVLITAGVFAATLSSALGSMMGAPRILQALARDEIFPSLRFFGHGSGASAEPRRATVVTFVIAQGGIMLGDLDLIAPIITMFFMITYGYLNLATFYESWTKNPSYRPTFRFSHWSTELAGALSCGAVMLLISPVAACASVLAIAALQWWIGRKQVQATWGDAKSGAAYERARRALLRLQEEALHPKNWRPSILALSGGAYNRVNLAVFGHWLTGGRGILTIAQIIVGDVAKHLDRRAAQEEVLEKFLGEEGLEAFPAVLVSPKLGLGIETLVQAYGIGALRPNVVLIGWSSDESRVEQFGVTLRTISGLKRSIVIMRSQSGTPDPWIAAPGTIDVWWRGKANGHLMLLLAYLLSQADPWRGRTVRLLRVISSEGGREEATRHLAQLISDARIKAEPVVIVDADARRAIRRASRKAAVVFLGFQPPEAGAEKAFIQGMSGTMPEDRTVLVVWSAGGMQLEA